MFRWTWVAVCVAAGCNSQIGSQEIDAGPPPVVTIDAAGPADAEVGPDANLEPLPDLTVNPQRARVDLAIREHTFDADSCELDPVESCIGGPGKRRLLHFSVETPNVGNVDMKLGAPDGANPAFEYSPCHDHYHFLGYAEYALLNEAGEAVATGQKQAFCLLDSEVWFEGDESVSVEKKYHCGFQGIQRGWSDVYHSRLGCQHIDVTDTPPGDYMLEIRLNNAGGLEELRYDNNRVTMPVSLGDPALLTPTEACATDLNAHATNTTNRECGWNLANVFDCTPGEKFRVGCAEECLGLGSCTGDPMMRVCDADREDANCSYPAAIDSDDDACGTKCPHIYNKRCPSSGKLAVYTAPFSLGAAYTCQVEFELLDN